VTTRLTVCRPTFRRGSAASIAPRIIIHPLSTTEKSNLPASEN